MQNQQTEIQELKPETEFFNEEPTKKLSDQHDSSEEKEQNINAAVNLEEEERKQNEMGEEPPMDENNENDQEGLVEVKGHTYDVSHGNSTLSQKV